ncbi:biopolymer transporter ExbD [Permianibacter sp. IMCC34836]|uniref:ExbD/TolR family protein n=1 Tax=Permianibacter fluminis TaxID=2738515 RepID=UPI001555F4E4|nr:biopolymer transporter ExbD [Permianibacter fluminis]NQD38736.1 biopolymer transporter ExbD [Permianibacter fluminis]
MARKQRGQTEDAQIDMTPMLDVVFIMLIFFITTASFVKESGVNIQHPKARSAEARPEANIFVGISAENTIWIDKRPVEANAVRSAVERLKQEVPVGSVVIQADKRSKAGVVVHVLDQVRAAGIADVTVAAARE